MRILVVEDEKNIAEYLKKGLQESGYVVDTVFDGEEAVYMASIYEYDLILLDVMIPKLDGVGVIKELRKNKNSSYVIMVTAKDKIEDRVKGLDAGADDYITKPFAFAELLARIRAVLRRGSDDKENILKVKNLEMDLVKREVKREGKLIELTSREFSLLEYFLRNKNMVLTRIMISERVWDIDFITETNVVDVYINHLRKKIDNNFKDKLIHTIRGVGYILKD
ncbi:response regulator [Haliovirga abyssi]|uniref:DNA-binding response regulator n=1 Tax=Haliovirga abyssi TaxID=2996794 RepID=A0AAU9DXT9_9FUSO|nr:response regulator transcription factor [Haliovirga abyssi]BDU50210.1 DNA-binding response regulator [Haliovirga abyssi]